jgi:hypothetical protein
VPNGPSVGPIDGGQEVLAHATVRKGSDGSWHFVTGIAGMEIGSVIDENNWLIKQAPKHAETVDIAGDKGQQASFDQKQPVVLMRLRAHEIVPGQNGGWDSKDDPQKNSDGIMVWLHQ